MTGSMGTLPSRTDLWPPASMGPCSAANAPARDKLVPVQTSAGPVATVGMALDDVMAALVFTQVYQTNDQLTTVSEFRTAGQREPGSLSPSFAVCSPRQPKEGKSLKKAGLLAPKDRDAERSFCRLRATSSGASDWSC